ncbi:MAG: hypothetical protein FWF25_01935 [Propionibacteriaceae bacterium]|nr:hypothetical protein [Propionibacteriaceae bacterium]
MPYVKKKDPRGDPQDRPSGPPPPDRYPQLSQFLRTEEGFKKSIRYSGSADSTVAAILMIAVLALFYNLAITMRAIADNHLPWNSFLREFFVVRGSSGEADPIIIFMVYAPIVAIPVIIVAWIIRRLTTSSALSKLYGQYIQGGFVAELVPTHIVVTVSSRTRARLYALGAPSVSPTWVTTAAEHMSVRASTNPKSSEARQYVKDLGQAVSKTLSSGAVQARQADQTIPAGIFITGQPSTGAETAVRVAIPDPDDRTQLRLYRLKKSVSLA